MKHEYPLRFDVLGNASYDGRAVTTRMTKDRSITLFSFGYWGWGNSTLQLVQAFDALEHGRGFKPPLLTRRLAQALPTLYPSGIRERRWVQGALAMKKDWVPYMEVIT